MKTPFPERLAIESTNVCNIMPPCVMCGKYVDDFGGYLHNDAGDFPKDLVPMLAEPISQCQHLMLHGGGEPLATERVFELANLAKPGCCVEFTSNGRLLTKEKVDRILSMPQIGLINFSLDAATSGTYLDIRHGDFHEVVENITHLIRKRNEKRLGRPLVWINMCLMRRNIGELVEFVELGAEMGVNTIHAFLMNNNVEGWRVGWFDYNSQHCSYDPKTFNEMTDAAVLRAAKLGVDLRVPPRMDESVVAPAPKPSRVLPKPDKIAFPFRPDEHKTTQYSPKDFEKKVSVSKGWTCHVPWSNAIVYRTGQVRNCCYHHGMLGTLQTSSFEELWNGRLMQDIRRATLLSTPHPSCTLGPTCPEIPNK